MNSQIWIDSEFITYLEETVQEIESLGLIGVKIEDNCMERLTTYEYILYYGNNVDFQIISVRFEVKIVIFFHTTERISPYHFQQHKFRRKIFPRNEMYKRRRLFYRQSRISNWSNQLSLAIILIYTIQNGRFYLSKVNAVDYLSRCYILENLSLTIDPRWIPEIIEVLYQNSYIKQC